MLTMLVHTSYGLQYSVTMRGHFQGSSGFLVRHVSVHAEHESVGI